MRKLRESTESNPLAQEHRSVNPIHEYVLVFLTRYVLQAHYSEVMAVVKDKSRWERLLDFCAIHAVVDEHTNIQ